MEPIVSVSEYQRLTGKYAGCRSNNLLFPSAAAALVGERRMFSVEQDNALLLLVDRDNIMNAYCMFRQDAALTSFPEQNDRPVILDVPARAKDPSIPFNSDPVWRELGFYPRTRHLLVAHTDSEMCRDDSPFSDKVREEFLITDEIIRLWNATLDVCGVEIPQKPRKLLPNERLFAIRDGYGRLESVVMSNLYSKKAYHHSQVTAPAARGRGLSSALVKKALGTLYSEGINAHFMWIDQNNRASLAVNGKIGFSYHGTVSDQYRLGVENDSAIYR